MAGAQKPRVTAQPISAPRTGIRADAVLMASIRSGILSPPPFGGSRRAPASVTHLREYIPHAAVASATTACTDNLRIRRGAVHSINRLKEGIAMRSSNCTLNRRDFVCAIGAATLGAGPVLGGERPLDPLSPGMKISLQIPGDFTEDDLVFAKQLGVEYVSIPTGGGTYETFASYKALNKQSRRRTPG